MSAESERRIAYERAAASLPSLDMSNWTWTDRDIDVLRKACAVRFDESLRTETLMMIAHAGMRLLLSRPSLGEEG